VNMTAGKLSWIEVRTRAWENVMRFLKTTAGAVLLVGALTACVAQRSRTHTPVPSNGASVRLPTPLTVWIVMPGTAAEKSRIAARKLQADLGKALPTTVQEQTAGSFGQASSDVGQTSGSYGQTSSSVGTNASDHGQTAGSYGTTAGSFGTSASNHGQTAGSAGQTAGSFGQTSSTYGQTLGGDGLSGAPPQNSTPQVNAGTEFVDVVGDSFPVKENVRYIRVVAEELAEKLAAAERSPDYPDVVIGLPNWWDRSGLGVANLWLTNFPEVSDPKLSPQPVPAAILLRAPHPAAARLFLLWLRDRPGCGLCILPNGGRAQDGPARIAVSAWDNVLQGAGLGTLADPEAAKFSVELARKSALGQFSPQILDTLRYQIDVTQSLANERLAVVSLRAVASSPVAFGVLHSLVVLRKNDTGQWKVLQISTNGSAGSVQSGGDALASFTRVADPAKVIGISQAAPPDDDNRPPQPDLWWDNAGDARLLVVEWQFNDGGGWTDTRLMMVPDGGNRTQTRVSAQFATSYGAYRWRVWSVGAGGVMTLSPWKRLNILP
jgi:hypothetical protein